MGVRRTHSRNKPNYFERHDVTWVREHLQDEHDITHELYYKPDIYPQRESQREQPTNLPSQPLLGTSNSSPSRSRVTNPFTTLLTNLCCVYSRAERSNSEAVRNAVTDSRGICSKPPAFLPANLGRTNRSVGWRTEHARP